MSAAHAGHGWLLVSETASRGSHPLDHHAASSEGSVSAIVFLGINLAGKQLVVVVVVMAVVIIAGFWLLLRRRR